VLLLFERSLIALNLLALTVPSNGHHPPGAYGTLVALPLLAAALVVSLRVRAVS
jgi:hypothetical protein